MLDCISYGSEAVNAAIESGAIVYVLQYPPSNGMNVARGRRNDPWSRLPRGGRGPDNFPFPQGSPLPPLGGSQGGEFVGQHAEGVGALQVHPGSSGEVKHDQLRWCWLGANAVEDGLADMVHIEIDQA